MNIEPKPIAYFLIFAVFGGFLLFSFLFCVFKWKKYYSINAYILKIGYYGYDLFFINIICFIVASIIWLHISYESYYHGLDSRTSKYNKEYFEQAKIIFNNKNDSLQECKDKFKFIASTSIAGISIID